MGNYFPQNFPTFWENINNAITIERLISVKEVYNELIQQGIKEHLEKWVKSNSHIFLTPTDEETNFVNTIFSISHFQYLVGQKQRLKGSPVADPFVIAAAKIKNGCVITEEENKPHAAKIPNVCEYFGVDCTGLEGFMEREGWTF